MLKDHPQYVTGRNMTKTIQRHISWAIRLSFAEVKQARCPVPTSRFSKKESQSSTVRQPQDQKVSPASFNELRMPARLHMPRRDLGNSIHNQHFGKILQNGFPDQTCAVKAK